MKKTSKVLMCLAMILMLSVSFFLVGCSQQTPTETTTHTISLSSNDTQMGKVYGSGTYAEGESIVIYAVAEEGYQFVKWSDESTEELRTIEITQDKNLSAYFEKIVDNPQPAMYYLNSIEFYLDDYENISVDRIEISYAEIFYAYPLYSLGGFNTDPTMIGNYYGLPLYFFTELADVDNTLMVYADKNQYNVFEEGKSIELSIKNNVSWFTVKEDGVSVDEHGSHNQNVSHTLTISSTSETKVFYEDAENNFKIMIKFNFVEL